MNRSNTPRARRRQQTRPAAPAQIGEAVRTCVEPLEGRTLLSATISVNDITNDQANHTFAVVYSDADGIDTSTIDASDVTVGGPKPVSVSLVAIEGGGTDVTAVFALAGPDGGWDQSDNGGYALSVAADSAKDLAGNNLDSGGVASFNVNVPPPPDNTGPSANISVGDVTSAGGGTHTVSVTYSDDSGINADTIDTGDVSVTVGGSSLNVVGLDVTGSGNVRTAVYTFQAPGGSWDPSDNGGYTVTLNAGAVTDGSANGNAGASAGFNVNVAPPPDNTGPSTSVGEGGTLNDRDSVPLTLTVTYSDAAGINLGSIGADDITVTAPGGKSIPVTGVNTSVNGNSVTVGYVISAPGGGGWKQQHNGDYTIAALAGAVTDNNGNGSAAGNGSLKVEVDAPLSTVQAGIVDTARTSTTLRITYRSDFGIDLSTIGTDDFTVSRGAPVTAAQVVSADATRETVVVDYTVVGPGGSWDFADEGEYQISFKPNGVKDDAGNSITAPFDFFGVSVPPSDGSRPTATIAPVSGITAAGTTSFNVVVTYTDDQALNAASIGNQDLFVARLPAASDKLTVSNVALAPSADGKSVVATYTVVPSGGGAFTAEHNGTYTVQVVGDSVTDAFGNGVNNAGTEVTIAIAGVEPPPLGQGPTVAISAGNVTAPGGADHTVTVTYTDDGRVRANTIGVDDLVVTNGGITLQVVDVTTTSNDGGSTITAVYTLAAPGGAWDTLDNGTYTITLAAGAVADNQGNGNAAAGGSFTVGATVADGAAPVVQGMSGGNISTEGVSTQTIFVTYTDDVGLNMTTVGTDDVTVSGPGGNLAVTDVIVVSSSPDGKTATVQYTLAAPNGAFAFADNGTYGVTVNANGVLDTAGKGVAAATGSFQVAVPEPTPIDAGFGGGAPVLSDFVVEAVSTGTGGKVLVAGRSAAGAVLEVRNADGSLDTTFNKTGQVVSTGDTAYYAVVAQNDKIVVAGMVGGDFVLVRYHADGRIDNTFGTGGRMVVDFGQPNDAAYALAVAPDGKLVAVGQSNGDFALARFMPDGALDPSFGQGGKQMFDYLGKLDAAGAVVVQTDGKVVVAGTSGADVLVIRLRADGEADTEFSGDGVLVVTGLVAREDATAVDRSAALALQSDGKILVGNHTAGGDFGVVRVTGLGNIDSSFGNDGLATADFGGADDADALIVQPTGEILVVGTSLSADTGVTTVAAFSSSGQLIEGFGEGGKLMLETGMSNPARELRIGDLVLRAFGTRQADGRVVVGTSNGSAPQTPPQASQSSLRRLNVPGTRSVPAGQELGRFGAINGGKNQKFTYTDADGTKITFAIKGGTGTLYLGADGKLNLILTDDGGGSTVTARGKGGDGRIAFGDISAAGSVKSMSVKNGDLSGTFCVTGTIGKLTLGNVSGASICSASNIGKIAVASLTNTRLLAGASLGADAAFGGTDANADSYVAAAISSLKVGGQIAGSTVGAGLDPVDATFLDEDDRVVGGAASFIRAISAKGADDASRFLSGAFGKVKLGAKVNPNTDDRFRVLQ